ncbi:twin-arginine translocase TatA/TatE family subunit [Xylanibacillus composti]|uniref:Sec-independent protein translocase protein TatA n=1 Tax=Xylanibacillus composti TaxID=1572762 RepID=A0A8J4H0N8_9BACL|nr:twin-arginine translocase TatA/TatE family subunit [Xylanibacillus composti]MDT9723832.1 twin-arginine translocase TatA/TatE family subunit [Xylanibacillus composti]GIQ67390.1 Sec-independent protein translocase protein TatAd [Xylanibacillus composti]
MLGNIGPTTLVLIILIALLLFGPSKLPELGRAFGRTLREFKKGANEVINEEEEKRKPEALKGDKENGNLMSAEGDRGKDASDNRRLPD